MGAVEGGANPARLAQGHPGLAAGLALEAQQTGLTEADDRRLTGVACPVSLQNAVLLGLEVRIVGALPAPTAWDPGLSSAATWGPQSTYRYKRDA